MEPTTRDRTTTETVAPVNSEIPKAGVGTWLVTLVGLACIAFGIPAIASIPDLGVALLIAGVIAATIIAATRVIARRTR